MHDELGEVAWRHGRRWIGAATFLLALAWAFVGGLVAGPIGAVVLLLVGLPASGWWLVRAGNGKIGQPSDTVAPAPPQVLGIAEGIGLATGTRPAQVLLVGSDAPDVGALPGNGGFDLLVTQGALPFFTSDELEAVAAAQLASFTDPHVRTMRNAADRLRGMRGGVFLAGFLIPPAFLLNAYLGAVVIAALAATSVAGWCTGGRVRFWARVGVDAAAVATTRHPQPLVSALDKLAAYNGKNVKLRSLLGKAGLADRFWVRSGGVNWTSTTTVNGRVTDERTREQVEDVVLLVRASLVRRVCVLGGEATLAGYDEVRDAVRSAGRAAAKGGTAVIEGRRVGLGGVEADLRQPEPRPTATPPAAGWYPDPWSPPGLLRWWDGTGWSASTTPVRPGPT